MRQANLPWPGAYEMRELSGRFMYEMRDAFERITLKRAALELDDVFARVDASGERVGSVSNSLLSMSFRDDTRNYPRAEWVPYLFKAPQGIDALRLVVDAAGYELVPKARPLTAEEKLRKVDEVLKASGTIGDDLRRRMGL